jgi:hypothetical protein
MRILAWLRTLGRREDAAAIRRARELKLETPAERATSSGDVEGIQADFGAAREEHEASIEDVERLGDDEEGPRQAR